MKFSKIYYNEAHIIGDRERDIIKSPKIVPMPKELKGKRLVTIVNNDDMYFTFVFDKYGKEPMSVIQGKADDPYGIVIPDSDVATRLYNKHYTPRSADKASPMEYAGEVRIHPPFEGYEEFPIDRDAEFFTDFNNPNSVYKSGDTVASPLTLVSNSEDEE